MVVNPGTAILIAAGISAAAKAGSDYFGNAKEKKASKRRARETERETKASMIQDALERSSDLQAHKMASRQKTGKAKSRTSQETADLVRGALKV